MGILRYIGRFFQPPNIIQLVAAALVAYYCFETHKLRQTSEAQLRAVQDQLNYQASPILHISFHEYSGPKPLKQPEPGNRHAIRDRNSLVEYRPYLANDGAQPALNVAIVEFDEQSQSYTWSAGFIPVVKGKSEQEISIPENPATPDRIRDAINRTFRVCDACIDESLKQTSTSFLLLFYRNSLGHAYYLKQPYTFKNGELSAIFPETRSIEGEPAGPNVSETYDAYYQR
jgi:hypothetical protein